MPRVFEDNLTIVLACRCGYRQKFIGAEKWVYGWASKAGWNTIPSGFECPMCAGAVRNSFEEIARDCMCGAVESGPMDENLEFEGRCCMEVIP